MHQRHGFGDEDVDDTHPIENAVRATPIMTAEDMGREEDTIRDLERKKKGLEERIGEMDKDLGGLMR